MKNGHPKRRLSWCAPAGLALLGSALAWPSLSQAAPPAPSCTIAQSATTVNVGGSIDWSASVSGISGNRQVYSWSFKGGNPGTSQNSIVRVTYANASVGSGFLTSLIVTDSRNANNQATCSATVTVVPTFSLLIV